MRKGIIMGLLAVVVIGVGAFVLLRPREQSIEYHIREYRRAYRKISRPPTWSDRVVNQWRELRGQPNVSYIKRVGDHKNALIGLRYLEVRTFVVSNRPVDYVASNIWFRAAARTNVLDEFSGMSTRGMDLIDVVARKEDMPKWEAAIRKVDVP